MKNGKAQIDLLTQKGFLKTGAPSVSLQAEDKAKLNLQGNRLLNQGSVDQAKKIFLTTHYSDGLCRVGDYYREKDDPVTALKFYTLSGRKDRFEPMIESAVQALRAVLKEDEKNLNEDRNHKSE